jgi:hypothetical protein
LANHASLSTQGDCRAAVAVARIIHEQGQAMGSIRTFPTTLFNPGKRPVGVAGWIVAFLAMIALSLSPALAVELPSDDDQDVLIRTTLMTFNDANMTGDYTVLFAKASKQFQAQLSVEKLTAAFEGFRKNELFFEEVVTADYDSSDKAKLDGEGALVLAGVFKTDDMQVKYKLRFVQNSKVWKVLGINVDATKL